jgi:hypothetical protein
MCLAFEEAEHQGSSVLLRQMIQLFIENWPKLGPGLLVRAICRWHGCGLPLMSATSRRNRSSFECCAKSDRVKPRSQGAASVQSVSFPGQDQERRLEGVFSVMPVLQDPLANAQHQSSIAMHQNRERSVVLAQHISLEQLPIRQVRNLTVR